VPKSGDIIGGDCAHGGLCCLFISTLSKLFRQCRESELYCLQHISGEEIAMHFCMTGQYTPRALNAIMENPTTNRFEAARKLIEAAGGKLISMYSTPAEGPGVLTIFDVPDPTAAPAICGVVVAAGTLQNVKLTRLLTQDEVMQVRQKASQLRAAYTPPGG
jgi:uncharacterized protein with GYD domain